MWSRDRGALVLRLAIVMASAGLSAGCFQPLYGQTPLSGGRTTQNVLAAIDVQHIDPPRGSAQARIAVELRNALLFDLTGGGGSIAPTHRLNIKMTTSTSATIVDPNTGRTEVATDRIVVNATGFARVGSDIPGQQQRFARWRAELDAQERAVQVLADQIRSRLASYLVAGT